MPHVARHERTVAPWRPERSSRRALLVAVVLAHLAAFFTWWQWPAAEATRVTAPPRIFATIVTAATPDRPPEPVPRTVPRVAPAKPRVAPAKPSVAPAKVAAPSSDAPVLAPLPSAPSMAVSAAPAVAVTTTVVASAPARELMPVVAPRFDAAYLDNPKPSYPPLARRFREQGVVMIDVRVTAAGFVETAKIRESSGSSRLDEAALAAVARWRFVPARQGGTAVAAWVVVPIRFALDSD